MRIENEAAYVLEIRPYRETSVLIEALTAEHGRIALVARGVRGEGKRQASRRAALEPFHRLRLSFSGRGDVLSLTGVDVEGTPLRPVGNALFAGIYVNELVQKLTGRGDPSIEIFVRYATWIAELGACLDTERAGEAGAEARRDRIDDAALAWSLRRFERDLLGLLGYALVLDHDSDSGEPLRLDADYALDPEHGARPWSNASPWPKAKGSTLVAWAGDRRPAPEEAAALRQLVRQVIRHHLGGAELRAWKLAAEWRTMPS